MSALFLLASPPLALAVYRVLKLRGVTAVAAGAAAIAAAVAATALPAWALRTKPSHGSPVGTPFGPAARGGPSELLVDFVSGWSQPEQRAGETVRLLSAHGQLAVGPSPSQRPRATLVFDASAAMPVRLAVGFRGETLRVAQIATQATHVSVPVPAGTGPAVVDLEVGGTIVVPVASVHAVVAP